ncbi:MAG: lysyl-tRNA synthetase class 2 [Flavobacteriaceae bacterium]|jgi:lysyl-tRNA synthetase class 2
MQLTEHEIVRREKLAKIKALGIDPYPAALYPVNTMSSDIENHYETGKSVVVSGRVMRKKLQGKASFAEIQDSKGRIQLYFNRDEIDRTPDSSLYNEVFKKLIDLGDILGIEGVLFTTQVGEKTILVKNFTLLCKALRPLPLPKTDAEGKVHDEFQDTELRYRQRYVDLIVNPKVKDTFIKRTKITNSIRKFFNDSGYLEVETPILQPIPGGASARPFVTHHNALNMPLYLRVANELYLKRLIVGGFDGVYEFSKDFRNEGMDRTHNPEFTVMELYVAYKDYLWMMDTTEKLLETIAIESNGATAITVGKNIIDFKAPYPRIPILEAIKIHTGYEVASLDRDALAGVAKSLKIEVSESMGIGKLIDEIFGECCEHHYIQPTFITDYPKEMSPLTKEHRSDSSLTERFELMVNGKELANAYSELNDPIDQRARFEDQLALSEKGDDEAMFIDQDFLRALEYGMPPTSGIGIGIDRLVMLMTNNASIQEVLFFPQMRPERKTIALSDDEKLIFELLKKTGTIPLLELKNTSALSGKAWDRSIKALTKLNLVLVAKQADVLICSIKES